MKILEVELCLRWARPTKAKIKAEEYPEVVIHEGKAYLRAGCSNYYDEVDYSYTLAVG